MEENTYFTGNPCKRGHISARYKCNNRCLECNTIRRNSPEYKATKNARRRAWRKKYGHEERRKRMINFDFRLADQIRKANARARDKGLPYNLTIQWAKSIWTGKCAITGIEFSPFTGKRDLFTATIDRIEANKGYIQENCRFILWGVNALKGIGTDEEMAIIAKAITENFYA